MASRFFVLQSYGQLRIVSGKAQRRETARVPSLHREPETLREGRGRFAFSGGDVFLREFMTAGEHVGTGSDPSPAMGG